MDATPATLTRICVPTPENLTQIHLDLVDISEENLMIHSRSIRSNCDPLGPIGASVKKFFVWKIFLVFTFLMALLSFAVSLINSVQQNSNNNNNNNNNNMNMNMNENMNARSLDNKQLERVKRWSNLFNAVELPPSLEAFFKKIQNKKHPYVKDQPKRRRLKNLLYQRGGPLAPLSTTTSTTTTAKPIHEKVLEDLKRLKLFPSTSEIKNSAPAPPSPSSRVPLVDFLLSPLKRVQNMTSVLSQRFHSQMDTLRHNFNSQAKKTYQTLEAQPQKVFSRIKAFVEPKIESLSNVTSNIVETVIEPKLDSLTNITNNILQTQKYQAEANFNKFIKEPLEKVTSDFETIKTIISRLKPEHVEIALKATPILIPHIIEHHTPKLQEFLKPGTEFTTQELFTIHQSLKDGHLFLQTMKNDTDDSLPTVHRLIQIVLDKNTKLMSHILVLMIKSQKEKKLILTSEDLDQIEQYLVSPKDLYLELVDEENKRKLKK